MKPEEMRDLIRYRMEQAEGALGDVHVLIRNLCTPISIINRSYYAMLYAALAVLQTIGKTPSKHSGALSVFDTEFVLSGRMSKHLGRSLHDVFELRSRTDYRVVPDLQFDDAVDASRKASEFVQAVRVYLAGNEWL